MTGPYVLMVKTAGSLCNMHCDYCYYIDKKQKQFMNSEVLEKMIRDYFTSYPGPVYSFVWHGGEPTLLGLDFYKYAVALQKKYLPKGTICWNNLQTNGSLLDEEWCRFLAEENFDVGISIDGSKAIHERYRHGASYDEIVAHIRLLQKQGKQPDLLCALTEDAARDALGTYRALKELNTGWIQFIPVISDKNTEASLQAKTYGEFLVSVFEEWIRNDIDHLGIQFFMELLNILSGGQASLCYMSKTCGRALIIEHDGSVYSCDHFVDEAHKLGTLQENSLSEMIDSRQQLAFGAQKHELSDRCKACRYLGLCYGGCPKDRTQGRYELCDGLLYFFEQESAKLQTIVSLLKDKKSLKEVKGYFKDGKNDSE